MVGLLKQVGFQKWLEHNIEGGCVPNVVLSIIPEFESITGEDLSANVMWLVLGTPKYDEHELFDRRCLLLARTCSMSMM